jgi:hypothetical protein
MAKPGKKAYVAPKEDAPVSTEVEAIVNAKEEAPIEEAPVVTTNVIATPIDAEALPGPEVKLELPPTLAEVATAIEQNDDVEIVGIRGFEGISGKVAEIRPDGYIVIRATTGTFAAPKANVKKV